MAKLVVFAALIASVESFALNAPVQRLPVARRAAALTMQQQTKEPETEKKGFFGKVFPTKEEKPAGEEEELSESKKLMQKVKDAGKAGIISYIFWEWAFWGGVQPLAAHAINFMRATLQCSPRAPLPLGRSLGSGRTLRLPDGVRLLAGLQRRRGHEEAWRRGVCLRQCGPLRGAAPHRPRARYDALGASEHRRQVRQEGGGVSPHTN